MGQDNQADLERGNTVDTLSTLPTSKGSSGTRCVGQVQNTVSLWLEKLFSLPSRKGEEKIKEKSTQVEDYPAGYPRFSALLASHDSFQICRRFNNLRSRLLLLKQDRLALLEKKLEKIDCDEVTQGHPLYLGSNRRDANNERASVLKDIENTLAEYDELIERNCRMLGREAALPREVANLTNWVNGTGCIARAETAYLACGKDLARVTTAEDVPLFWLDIIAGNVLVLFRKCFFRRPRHDISRSPHVHIFSRPFTGRIARVLVTPFLVALLLAPAIACVKITALTSRLIIVATATTVLVALLSIVTKAKTVEMFLASAAYSAVLIVFISSQNQSQSSTITRRAVNSFA